MKHWLDLRHLHGDLSDSLKAVKGI